MMPALTTNIDASALRRKFDGAPQRLEKNLRIALERTVQTAALYARMTTLFRHVTLGWRQGIKTHFVAGFGGMIGTVAATAPYAGFLEYGTDAHFVAPRRRQVLAFVVNGAMCFSRGHWVSGIKPRSAMMQARDRALPLFERLTIEAIANALG